MKTVKRKNISLFSTCQEKLLDAILPNAKAEFYGTKPLLDRSH